MVGISTPITTWTAGRVVSSAVVPVEELLHQIFGVEQAQEYCFIFSGCAGWEFQFRFTDFGRTKEAFYLELVVN